MNKKHRRLYLMVRYTSVILAGFYVIIHSKSFNIFQPRYSLNQNLSIWFVQIHNMYMILIHFSDCIQLPIK
jgi:ABC-type uncharacterized transport system permease subunit